VVEKGLGSSLLPAELARRDSALFGKGTEVTVVTGRCTGRGHGMTGRVRLVQSGQRA
jgi:hypothetical protein